MQSTNSLAIKEINITNQLILNISIKDQCCSQPELGIRVAWCMKMLTQN